MLGVLYDIHGNIPALERVLEEADVLVVDRWLLGGDYGTPSPWPLETLDRLKQLPSATWIRESYALFTGGLSDDVVDWLYGLPPQAEVEGTLFVHGSPLSDVQSFAPEPQPGEETMLAGVHDRLVVFGHSHQQFRRLGPDGTDLLNPGSVGMPLDGDTRSAWATFDGDFMFRRTEYDVERAAEAYRGMGGNFGEFAANRILRGSD